MSQEREMIGDDPRECRIYRRRGRVRARVARDGIGYEVIDGEDITRYLAEDFRREFELAAQSAVVVDSKRQIVHYE